MTLLILELKERQGGQLEVQFRGRGEAATKTENQAASMLVPMLHDLLLKVFGNPISVAQIHQDKNQEKPENQERKENNDGRTPNPLSQAEP